MGQKNILKQLTDWSVFIIATLLAASSAFFWLTKYPAHIAFQEGAQLFLWNSSFFSQAVCSPAGLATYIGAFLTQFYYELWLGATIITALITAIYVLSYIVLLKSFKGYRLLISLVSLAPAVFSWFFLLDKHSLLAMPVGLLFTLAAIIAYLSLRHFLKNRYLYIIYVASSIFLLYFFFGAISFLYTIYIVVWEVAKNKSYLHLGFAAFAALIPLLFSFFVPGPVSRLYCSNCYYRVLDGTPSLEYNTFDEDALHYSFYSRYNQWGNIIKRAEKQMPLDMASRQILLCALAQKGLLLDRLFDFPVMNIKDLLSEQMGNMTEPMMVSDVFFNIGFLNIAEQAAHNAQQMLQNYSVRSYQRWAECTLIKGDNRLAMKYLDALEQTLFYADWAKSRKEMVGNIQAIEANRVYGPISHRLMSSTYYFSNSDMDNILAHSVGMSQDFNINYDYLIAFLILNNDLDKLAALHNGYTGRLGKATQEALTLHWLQNHPSIDGIPWPIDKQVVSNAMEFYNVLNRGGNMQSMHARFSKTYWYYYNFASRLFE